jgi:hypothetical protein
MRSLYIDVYLAVLTSFLGFLWLFNVAGISNVVGEWPAHAIAIQYTHLFPTSARNKRQFFLKVALLSPIPRENASESE